MATGWSWDPAAVLGRVDSNRPRTSLPAGDLFKPIPTLPPLMGHDDENLAPQELAEQAPKAFAAPSSADTPKAASTAAKRTASSKKRKSDAVAEPTTVPEIDDDDPRLQEVDQTCGQVRAKIRRFLDSGAMKVGEFQSAIDVGSVGYHRFMKQSGPDAGSGSDVYYNAWKFFKKRELQGVKAPAAKKAKPTVKTAAELDVADIKLDGEDEGEVPVFDTCDEIRKKIRAFLRKDGITNAAYLRAIGACFPEGRKIQSKQLNDFLAKKGPVSGNTSAVFYGSYVFLEKLRVKQGKPKSAMRVEMEKLYPSGNKSERDDGKAGMDTKRMLDGPIFLHASERAHVDKYGKMKITTR
ncbi:hypothetical protein JX265_000798 [Neoarthrinium moseri]|uniref:DUF7726 domain-containing protein n=1 Tax=Neoarthrinium moseri TaxID=1658444 RepID=A0A9P9WWH4_9PEZI|nr:uncharacterized protein JN550_007096 [Neoarthrinium moseri]KAI1847547.1 hypothetical protein JX266_006399 [Neoarthrinium moseri]KAI1867365.1 hypothetical protein JN550_007096 [Neoarthrinium moseri]KAI1880558.1 hypothetical protein JX265_000798 [Neoarthrinium moseri]